MRVLSLFQAIRLASILYKLDVSHVESYQGYSELVRHKYTGSHLSEGQIRESYDKWRRDIVKAEVRKEFEDAYFRDLVAMSLKSWPRRINVMTMCLLAIAVLIFKAETLNRFVCFEYSGKPL